MKKVIIENQLEFTDYDHIGKIITYASGYDANIIVWIVKNKRDEHKKDSGIRIERDGDLTKENKWKDYFEWLLTKALKFKEVFPEYVNEVN